MTSYRSGSYGIKSPADQDLVLYNIMLIRFVSGITSPTDQDTVLYSMIPIE